MSPLWQTGEAAAALGLAASPALGGVSIDTRTLVPGDLFVALQGEARDGHDFVAAAFAAGAAAALVTHRPQGVAANAPLLVVPDTLVALGGLARAARARTRAQVVGVTGSVGKTSTKEMLRAMLATVGQVHAAEKSYNNHWGVPLTLARMPRETEYAVLEIGMNHPGEITPLSRLTRPDAAIITTVEAVHLEAFESVEGIADAKAEIFAGLPPGGTAILNADNAHFARLARAAGTHRLVRFGGPGADVALERVSLTDTATVVRALVWGQPHSFKIGAPGRHLAMNALAALAAVHVLGADPARAGLALGQWSPPDGRGARWSVRIGPGGLDGTITLLDDSYNANPASMGAGLAVLAAASVTDGTGRVRRGRRIAILGDMLELGPNEAAFHAGLASLSELAEITTVHCCGPRMAAMHAALPRAVRGEHFATSTELAAQVRRLLDGGDVCMVKGSLGMAMGQIVTAIRALGTATPAHLEE